jgi:hypothetical protein
MPQLAIIASHFDQSGARAEFLRTKAGLSPRPADPTHPLQSAAQAACEAAWRSFLRGFGSRYLRLRAAVQALAALDCLCGLALLASSHGWVGAVPPAAARRLAANAIRSSRTAASLRQPAARRPSGWSPPPPSSRVGMCAPSWRGKRRRRRW